MNKKYLLLSLLVILHTSLFSCAPKVQDTETKTPEVPELQSSDIALQKAYKSPFATINFAIKKIAGQKILPLQSINQLFEVGEQLSDENAKEKANEVLNKNLLDGVYKKSTKEISSTNYLQLVEEQTASTLKNSVDGTTKKILADTDLIESIINASLQEPQQQTTATSELKIQLLTAEVLLNDILQKIQAASIFAELKTQVVQQLNTQAKSLLSKVSAFDKELTNTQGLSDKINLIQQFIKDLGFELSTENQAALNGGKKLGDSILKVTDAQTALQTLALTWQMLTVEERNQYFKPANEKLFSLFDKKSEADIQCLIDSNCKGLISKLVLNIGVYPALDNYGIDKIKTDINTAAVGFLNKKINSVAYDKITDLTSTIKNQIRSNVEKNLGQVQDFKNRFKSNLALGLQKVFKTEKLDFYAIDNQNTNIQDQLYLMMNDLKSLPYSAGSDKNLKQFLLIEKVLSLVEFSGQSKSLLKNGITNYLKDTKELLLTKNLQSTNIVLQVKDQALAINLLSQMLTATADWQPTVFDTGITDIKAQDLISDVKSADLNQSLFPKVQLFNICLSMATKVLKQIQSQSSLVYLIDNQSQRIPIAQYLTDKNHTTVALGAASDQVNGRLVNLTRLGDLAELIKALSAFSKATADISKSKSDVLKNPLVLEQIQNAHKSIELLILTLANFISSQMVGPQYLVADVYNFELQLVNNDYQLKNQVAAISALVTAYETTGINIYLTSAKELYFSLNKNYYDPELKFYKNNLNAALQNNVAASTSADVLNSLNNLIQIRKYLNLTSQVQFDRIFENWYVALLL